MSGRVAIEPRHQLTERSPLGQMPRHSDSCSTAMTKGRTPFGLARGDLEPPPHGGVEWAARRHQLPRQAGRACPPCNHHVRPLQGCECSSTSVPSRGRRAPSPTHHVNDSPLIPVIPEEPLCLYHETALVRGSQPWVGRVCNMHSKLHGTCHDRNPRNDTRRAQCQPSRQYARHN